jgi:LysM repeat protein
MAVEKLTIIGFEDDTFGTELFPKDESMVFSVMINPTSIKTNYDMEIVADDKDGAGDNASGNTDSNIAPVVKGRKPESISFDFVLDGTGVLSSGEVTSVKKHIDLLKSNTYNVIADENDKYRFPFSSIKYGEMEFQGVLKKLDVEYTLFKADGEPLRAKVALDFQKAVNKTLEEANNKMKKSGSVGSYPQVITVKKGDTLSALCQKVYKNANLYIKVAKDNNMKSPNIIHVGDVITFKDPADL